MALFARLLRRRTRFDPPRTEGRVLAMGDLHGRADLMEAALTAAAAEGPATLVLLGDYVDRGPDAAAVLARAQALAEGRDAVPGLDRVVALMGNHERMMLDMLDDPVRHGRRWLRYGGLDTLRSFGIGGLSDLATPPQLRDAADALRTAMPDGQDAWLRALPASWRSGDTFFVHAGLDPAAPPDGQPPKMAIWGHPDFLRMPRTDGLWVVHGHTIVDAPSAEAGRIACDTGAYETGRLTTAVLGEGPVRFLCTTG